MAGIVRLPVALGAVPVGLRFRRGRAPGFALLRVIEGGLPEDEDRDISAR